MNKFVDPGPDERGMAEQAAYEQAISDQATFAALVEVARAAAKINSRGDTVHVCNKNQCEHCYIHWETCQEIHNALVELNALNPKLLEKEN